MAREATDLILTMIDEGVLDRDTVILACLKYMSEDDVRDMAQINEFFYDEEDDGQPDEAQEWYDFDPDC